MDGRTIGYGNVTEEFTAVLRNGQGENISGEVTYSLEGAPNGGSRKADELLKWWPNDFNHYTSDLSKLILPELTKQFAALISIK